LALAPVPTVISSITKPLARVFFFGAFSAVGSGFFSSLAGAFFSSLAGAFFSAGFFSAGFFSTGFFSSLAGAAFFSFLV